jgi:hypothetical protein
MKTARLPLLHTPARAPVHRSLSQANVSFGGDGPSRRRCLLGLGSLGVLGAAWVLARPANAVEQVVLSMGQSVPLFKLADQRGDTVRWDARTQYIIFTADKAGNQLVNDALKPFGSDALLARRAIYVADISGMPALITRMFALPRLKELPYSVGLVYDASLTASWPRGSGMATVMSLDGGLIRSVDFFSDVGTLRSALRWPADPGQGAVAASAP